MVTNFVTYDNKCGYQPFQEINKKKKKSVLNTKILLFCIKFGYNM